MGSDRSARERNCLWEETQPTRRGYVAIIDWCGRESDWLPRYGGASLSLTRPRTNDDNSDRQSVGGCRTQKVTKVCARLREERVSASVSGAAIDGIRTPSLSYATPRNSPRTGSRARHAPTTPARFRAARLLQCWLRAADSLTMARPSAAAKAPSDATIALSVAVSLLLFAWGLGEFIRSL